MHALATEPATVAGWILWALAAVAVVGVVYALVTDDREPTIVLAWLFVILLIPVLGMVAYFFLGRDFRQGTVVHPDHEAPEVLAENLRSAAGARDRLRLRVCRDHDCQPPRDSKAADRAGRQAGGGHGPPGGVRREVVLRRRGQVPGPVGGPPRRDTYIHLMYLIWERDELTAEVTEILLERLRAGVEVNIIYDWLSSLPFKKDELKALAAGGARVVPCYKRASQLNYRNHMKMAIIDGRVVYSGGMNMGQEYIDGGSRFDVWRDTHLRLSGPVVAPYLSLFASTWTRTGRDEDLFTGYVAATDAPGRPGVPVQVLHSSVRTQFPTLRDVFLVAIDERPPPRLDPVALLRAGRTPDHGDVRGRGQRCRRAPDDDRSPGQEGALPCGPRLLREAARGRRDGLHSTTPASSTPRP